MSVPDSCSEWRDRMAQGNDTSHVLGNLERDLCVPAATEEFYRCLALTAPWTDWEEAWDAAKQIVWGDPDTLCCCGGSVPHDLFFSLVRFMMVRTIIRGLDDLDPGTSADLINRYHIDTCNPDHWPEDLTEDRLSALCDELASDCSTGYPNGVTWVADAHEVPWNKPDLREILRGLGLPHFENQIWVQVLRYNRADIKPKKLHVPRTLDAIDNPDFDVAVDCNATTGITKPTLEAEVGTTGYREAVHRTCNTTMETLEIKRIDGNPS